MCFVGDKNAQTFLPTMPHYNPNPPFSISHEDFLNVCVDCHGNVSQIARQLGIHKITLYEYFKRDSEGKKILQDVREHCTNALIDSAERVVYHNLDNYERKPALAQKAAEYVLTKKGRSRGWFPDAADINLTEWNAQLDALMKYFSAAQSSSKSDCSNNSTESKS